MAITWKARGEIAEPTEGVRLSAQFYDLNGNETDLTAFPQITITQPSGNVILGPTSAGVYRLGIGLYGFDYPLSYSAPLGVYSDTWRGIIPTGQIITKQFNFIVYSSDAPTIQNSDGYIALGDDPGFHYSQTATYNINKILKAVRARLRSSGKAYTKDQFGNPIYTDCDIFDIDTLVTYVAQSLTMFNEIPHFTNFTFDHTQIIDQFFDVLVQGAVVLALAGQALLERGKEYTFSDNGISFNPPSLSELLNTQWTTELQAHKEKVSVIKLSMKPAPIGLGSMWGTTGRNPVLMRLRHLRARQII